MPKNIVITGGNNGIGYQTVKAMYLDGHNVIFGSRNTQKNQQAISQITQSSSKGSVKAFGLDLSQKHSIEQFVRYIQQNFSQIDILVNNAGLMLGKQKQICEELNGYEMTLVINHFGHFYLTYLLFGLLKKSKQARIINLSSTAHYQAGQNFIDDLRCTQSYSAFKQYQNSKLCNVVFTVGLDSFLKKNNITHIKSASLHPGVVDTGFGNISLQESGCLRCIKSCFKCCLRTQQAGATTSIYLCRVPFEQIRSGQYYDSDNQIKQMNKVARIVYHVQKLWKISQKAYGISFQ